MQANLNCSSKEQPGTRLKDGRENEGPPWACLLLQKWRGTEWGFAWTGNRKFLLYFQGALDVFLSQVSQLASKSPSVHSVSCTSRPNPRPSKMAFMARGLSGGKEVVVVGGGLRSLFRNMGF